MIATARYAVDGIPELFDNARYGVTSNMTGRNMRICINIVPVIRHNKDLVEAESTTSR